MSEDTKSRAVDLPPLPPGWAWTTIGRLLREPLRNGHSAKASLTGQGIRTLTLSAVTYGDFCERNTKLTVAKPEDVGALWLQRGDIFVERSNTPELVGTAALYRGPANYAIFPDLLIRIRVHPAISERYIAALLHLPESRRYFRTKAQGISGSMPKIDQGTVESLPVPLAPSAEQRRIVGRLEEVFSDLDAGLAALVRVRANLKRYRAAVLKAAVEGALTEEWRDAHPATEPASKLLDRILAERRRKWEADQLAKFAAFDKAPPKDWQSKYVEPAPPDASALPELPPGWCWTTLDAVAEVEGGITKDKNRLRTSTMREVPYLRVANVQEGHLDLSEMKTILAEEEEIQSLRLQPGDILFTEGGDRDKLGRGWVWNSELAECIHQNHIFRARPNLDAIEPKFVSIHGNVFGRVWFTRTGKQTTNLASINKGVLRRFPIRLPPLDEQRQIVAAVEERLSVVAAAEAQIEADLQRAARLRQSILKEAFAGKFVPQNPDDEPASILLERIRQERASTTATSPAESDGRNRRRTRRTAEEDKA
jgi:type I restriction enzyme, S subunit